MYKRLVLLLKTTTVRQSVVTSASTFAYAGLGAVFYLLVARLVGPAEFGLLSLALQITLSVSSIADVGIATTLVRFVGEHAASPKYLTFASLALRTKLVLGSISIFLIIFFSNFIGNNLLHQPAIIPLLPIAGFGVMAIMLLSFSTSTLQGLQKFMPWGFIQIGANVLRLIIIGALFAGGYLTAKTSLLAFILSIFSGFLLAWIWLDKKIITSPVTREVWKQFWHYSRWTAGFTMLSALVSRLDSFFTARYLDASQLGIYYLALTMSSFLPQLTVALGAVTSPKFASFQNYAQAKTYLKKSLLFNFAVSAGVALLMIPVSLLVIRFTGKDYSSSFLPYLTLLLALVIFSSTSPLRDTILYSFKKPQIFFLASVLQGVVIIIFSLTLIPRLGILGAGLSTLISHIVLALYVTYQYKKQSALHK